MKRKLIMLPGLMLILAIVVAARQGSQNPAVPR